MVYTFPDTYDTAPCYLLPINASLIPLVAGALKPFEERRSWHTDEEHEQAYNAFAALEIQMTACTIDALVESNNRLYRLLDTSLNGAVYTADGDPVVISPEIPDVPELPDPLGGLAGMVDSLPGILDAGWFGIGGHKATLADVVNALRVGNTTTGETLVGQLEDILGAGGNIAQIGETVTELFTGAVSNIEEGGMLIVLSAGIVGTLSAVGAVSAQLNILSLQLSRLINSVDGGDLVGPTDNILRALRGGTVADSDRNVIDAILTGLATTHTDDTDLLAKLEAIRALLV